MVPSPIGSQAIGGITRSPHVVGFAEARCPYRRRRNSNPRSPAACCRAVRSCSLACPLNSRLTVPLAVLTRIIGLRRQASPWKFSIRASPAAGSSVGRAPASHVCRQAQNPSREVVNSRRDSHFSASRLLPCLGVEGTQAHGRVARRLLPRHSAPPGSLEVRRGDSTEASQFAYFTLMFLHFGTDAAPLLSVTVRHTANVRLPA